MKSIAERIVSGVESYFGTAGVLHILVSKVIVDAFELFAPLWAAVIVAAAFGLLKEFVYDRWLGKGTFDRKDFLADAIGIALGLI